MGGVVLMAVEASSASAEQTFILRDREGGDDMIAVGMNHSISCKIHTLIALVR